MLVVETVEMLEFWSVDTMDKHWVVQTVVEKDIAKVVYLAACWAMHWVGSMVHERDGHLVAS